jgi:flavin reductase (DIM6/NTAB) family NADH-FMN oxidoreductase RutF/NAD(P)-dependent dehydrogenase (short-subunit alcohol dehydrogenase family)
MQMLVAGGTGGVGEGIVDALLGAGHRVIVPSRSAARLERLRGDVAGDPERAERLVTVTGDIGTIDGAAAIRDRIARDFGRLDVVIPSLGGWWQGGLLDATPPVWDVVMNEMLRTHYVFAHVFVPVLLAQPGGGRYIGIGGGAAYNPIRNSNLVSIAAAAQLMLTRALRQEIDDAAVDVLELVVDGPVRTRDSESIAGPDWILAADVGRIVAELAVTGQTQDPSTDTSGAIVRMRHHRTAAIAEPHRAAFTGICTSLDFPMTVVTAFDGRERSGCLVGFHTQCSIEPQRWLVCISKTNHTYGVARDADYLALHFLREDQHELAQLFGGVSEDDIAPHEKFERCAWHAGARGTPIIDGCDYIAGRVLKRTDAGDHVAHVIDVSDAGKHHAPAPQLGSRAVRDIHPGHAP